LFSRFIFDTREEMASGLEAGHFLYFSRARRHKSGSIKRDFAITSSGDMTQRQTYPPRCSIYPPVWRTTSTTPLLIPLTYTHRAFLPEMIDRTVREGLHSPSSTHHDAGMHPRRKQSCSLQT